MFLLQNIKETPDKSERFKFNKNQIIKNSFKIEEQIGKGSFSNVFKVRDLLCNKYYALKISKNNDKIIKECLNEVKLLSNLKEKELHNITKIYKTFYYNNHLCILLKLYNISLKKYLINYGAFSYNKTLFTLTKIKDTLVYLQNKNIIHRDLKLDNILFKDNYLSDIILIDFSISVKFNEHYDNRIVQTIWYRAPEIYLNFDYDYRLDIWSLGCIAFELFFNEVLFKCYSDERLFIQHNLYLNFPKPSFIKLMHNNYKMMYDSIEEPSFITINNLYYTEKKGKFINDYNLKQNANKILDIVFKCCVWNCFERPFANDIIL